MNDRVYILFNIIAGCPEQVAEVLQGMPGVSITDVLEGPPDIIVLIEAYNRYELAEFTSKVLASVENVVELSQLLPVSNGSK